VENGEGFHPHQVVKDHGGVGVMYSIIEMISPDWRLMWRVVKGSTLTR